MDAFNTIKQLIYQGDTEEAIRQLDELLLHDIGDKAQAYYLRGNAFRKRGDWKGALDSYQQAIDLNPTSPALQARQMVMDILNFYNKDMYNQ